MQRDAVVGRQTQAGTGNQCDYGGAELATGRCGGVTALKQATSDIEFIRGPQNSLCNITAGSVAGFQIPSVRTLNEACSTSVQYAQHQLSMQLPPMTLDPPIMCACRLTRPRKHRLPKLMAHNRPTFTPIAHLHSQPTAILRAAVQARTKQKHCRSAQNWTRWNVRRCRVCTNGLGFKQPSNATLSPDESREQEVRDQGPQRQQRPLALIE